MPEQTATDKMREILKKVQTSASAEIASLVANDLTDDFFSGEYMLVQLSDVVCSKELRRGDQVKLLVFHQGDLGIPYLAHLILTSDGWKLKSFMAQCLCCFGEGTMVAKDSPYPEPCNCCGGKGWGSAAF